MATEITTNTPQPESTSINNSSISAQSSTLTQTWKPYVRRPRVTLSCRICKMRKVRCDRATPVCRRCVNGGWADSCTYDTDVERSRRRQSTAPSTEDTTDHATIVVQQRKQPNENVATMHAPPMSSSGSDLMSVPPMFLGSDQALSYDALDQSHRLDAFLPDVTHLSNLPSTSDMFPSLHTSPLEHSLVHSMTGFCGPFDTQSNQHMTFQSSPQSESEIAMHGVGFETTFSGPTSSMSCLSQFPNFIDCLNKVTLDHVPIWSPSAVSDLDFPRTTRRSVPSPMTTDALSKILPPQFRCQQLLQMYFKYYNYSYRILHPPVFWRRYNEFWNRPIDLADPMPYIILSAISCVRCLEKESSAAYDGDSSIANDEAFRWTICAKQWSDRQGLKHTTLEFFQLKCLIQLSSKLNIIKARSHYPSSQTLLAIAMSTALHRSVDCLSYRTNFYEREMRRRIWWAITELELAECIEHGLPSLVENLHTDNEPPSNISDTDLDENTTYPSTHYPETFFTESSFARQGKSVQALRYKVNTLANNVPKHRAMSSSDINTIHEEVIGRLSDIIASSTFQSVENNGGVVLCRTILEVYLHELLLLLHLPFALLGSEKSSHPHSRFICQGSARSTIELFQGLDTVGMTQMCLPRTYLQRAVLVLCRLDSMTLTRNPIYMPSVDAVAAVKLTQQVFDMYEERIMTRGDGFRGLWLIFAASCYLRQNHDVATAALWKERTSARIIAMCSKISMSQPRDAQSEQRRDAVFARYMKHLRRTAVFAGFDAAES